MGTQRGLGESGEVVDAKISLVAEQADGSVSSDGVDRCGSYLLCDTEKRRDANVQRLTDDEVLRSVGHNPSGA